MCVFESKKSDEQTKKMLLIGMQNYTMCSKFGYFSCI